MEQRFEKDLQKIMGAGGKKRVQTREATQEDINAYKADGIDISLTNEDGSPTMLYYTTKGTSVTADPKVKTTKGNQGKAFYDKVRKDPVGYYQERTGIKPGYEVNAKGETIITLPEDDKNPKEVFNMSNSAQRKDFYNQLLKLSEKALGNSADSKNIRNEFEDALSIGTARKNRSKGNKGAGQFNTKQ